MILVNKRHKKCRIKELILCAHNNLSFSVIFEKRIKQNNQ